MQRHSPGIIYRLTSSELEVKRYRPQQGICSHFHIWSHEVFQVNTARWKRGIIHSFLHKISLRFLWSSPNIVTSMNKHTYLWRFHWCILFLHIRLTRLHLKCLVRERGTDASRKKVMTDTGHDQVMTNEHENNNNNNNMEGRITWKQMK